MGVISKAFWTCRNPGEMAGFGGSSGHDFCVIDKSRGAEIKVVCVPLGNTRHIVRSEQTTCRNGQSMIR
jgi:hypothetical protein